MVSKRSDLSSSPPPKTLTMSSRLKERGGAGAKIMASHPQKPLPTDGTPVHKISSAAARRSTPTSGKENTRSLSRGRAYKQPEKPPAVVAVPPSAGLRWSTSSLPRGKPSNPSDISKMLSDLRRDRIPRISGADRIETVQRTSLGGGRVIDRCQQGKVGLGSGSKAKDERPASGVRPLDNRKSLPLQPVRNSSRVSDPKSGRSIVTKTATFSVNSRNSSEKSARIKSDSKSRTGEALQQCHKNGGAIVRVYKDETVPAMSSVCLDEKDMILGCPKEGSSLGSDLNATGELVEHSADDLANQKARSCLASQSQDRLKLGLDVVSVMNKSDGQRLTGLANRAEAVEPVSDKIKVFEKSKIVKSDLDVEGVAVANKYPSKLREKLALLEGKVQNIASEIKRTKDMLDLNNPSESKLILFDIQNKIAGIENAMGHVIEGNKPQSGQLETNNVDNKISAKGLNHDELEARFFPHHRLLSDRTSSDSSARHDQNSIVTASKQDSDPVAKDGLLVPVDENPITIEFLASLNEKQAETEKYNGSLLSVDAAVREVGLDRMSVSHPVASNALGGDKREDIVLLANEKLEDPDDQENMPSMRVHDLVEESFANELIDIGQKYSTSGWFVSEGEAVLLAHDDGSCSYYDIGNLEVKAEYKPPTTVSRNLWGDCWLIRAPGIDGCSGRYVVAASAGNSVDSGFCSWDFYTRDIKAVCVEAEAPTSSSTTSSRAVLAPLNNSSLRRRSAVSSMPSMESQQWWYRPCGPLLVSTASRQKTASAYDIRDGDLVMRWEVGSPVMAMEYSSPLQWRSRGKVIIAETEAISLWDVNSLNPHPLLAVPLAGKKVYSLHVNNTDAEPGGGVRQRVSSSEVEGNDGVFCTQDSINVFDFRLPSGVGLRISRHGAKGHSIYSRGDSIFIGCMEERLPIKGGPCSQVQHFSLRKAKLAAAYALPGINSHSHYSSMTQVWGNSDLVMGICRTGLFVFDALKDDAFQPFGTPYGNTAEVKDRIGPDDLYCPTFDYLGSRVLVISRDRPAVWRYLL